MHAHTVSDRELEAALDRARLQMIGAKTVAARRKAFDTLKALHKQRSHHQVRQMEIQMGLR